MSSGPVSTTTSKIPTTTTSAIATPPKRIADNAEVQYKKDKADEELKKTLINTVTKNVLDIEIVEDTDFEKFQKSKLDTPEKLVTLENSIGEIKDAETGSVTIKSVKYYKNNLQEEVSITSGITNTTEFRFIPGRAFFIDFEWNPPSAPDPTKYDLSLKKLDASFILECFSPEIEKRDIKPGSIYYKRNTYEATNTKKTEVEKEIQDNITHLSNLVKYLNNSVEEKTDSYDIVNPTNPAAPTTSDHEIIFGKGTTSIAANKTTDGIYNIPANVIKTLSRVSTNVENIKKIMDTSYYKQNYSIDRWREFVKNYVDNLMNVNSAGDTALRRKLLDGQKTLEDIKPIPGGAATWTPGDTTKDLEENMNEFFKACKDSNVTSLQKRELYSLAAFDADFVKLVYFDIKKINDGGKMSLGPNYKFGKEQMHLNPQGFLVDSTGKTHFWTNAASTTSKHDETEGQISFAEDDSMDRSHPNIDMLKGTRTPGMLRMFQHKNKTTDTDYSNIDMSFGGKRKTKKRRTHKKRSSRKRR